MLDKSITKSTYESELIRETIDNHNVIKNVQTKNSGGLTSLKSPIQLLREKRCLILFPNLRIMNIRLSINRNPNWPMERRNLVAG
jgi:hypothetical protein